MAVKLNGVIASTKPSRGRWSIRFQTPVEDRLLGEHPGPERDVPAQEVDQLAGAVDLGLVAALALAQHGRGVQGVPPRAGQQLGRSQQHRGAVVVGQRPPGRGGGPGGVDGGADIVSAGLPGPAEQGFVPVRLHHVDR